MDDHVQFFSWDDLSVGYNLSLAEKHFFLDEVQNIKEFQRLVDSLYIKPRVDIYITGSNAYMIFGELATLLTGRYVET